MERERERERVGGRKRKEIRGEIVDVGRELM